MTCRFQAAFKFLENCCTITPMPKISNNLKLSRSSLKLFLECPRCFWLDLHHKIKRPPGYPYTLSAAVDYLVKQEFDKYRVEGKLPPVFKKENLNAKLFNGPELPEWRNNFKGISYYDEDLNAILFGAIDDVLEFDDKSLAVVDYKSSGAKEITIYDDYQKQMDVYTHILGRRGYKIQDRAYFVFYIVEKSSGGFKNTLPFREELRIIDINPNWVQNTFVNAVQVARQDSPPESKDDCRHCQFVEMASKHKLIPDLNI